MLAKAVILLLCILGVLSSLPQENTQGLPNTQCSMEEQPTLGGMKSVSCLLESVVMEPLKNPAIESFDLFRQNINSPEALGAFMQTLQHCNCLVPPQNTSEYHADPVYNTGPHVTVRQLYDTRINPSTIVFQERQYLPEPIVNGNMTASLTTEWLLSDHINSLEGFVSYFSQHEGDSEWSNLVEIAVTLNNSVLSLINFNFSSQCPQDKRVPNFSGFPSTSCELRCAAWHFNWTVQGLYYALGNQVIYPPASPIPQSQNDAYPELEAWVGMDCCDATPLHSMSVYDMRNLSCAVELVGLKAYEMFKLLGAEATTQCSNVATVTGIKTWTDYVPENKFPPLSWSKTANLYIYGNHFETFSKQAADIKKLLSSPDIQCYSSTFQEQLQKIGELFDANILPSAAHWLLSHNCPSCSTCSSQSATPPNLTPITGNSACPESRREVSCLALDVYKIAESAYMYLNMRAESKSGWSTSCSGIWKDF
ncbi:PREDICTED: uncharacterized protein LOC109582573 [Amphimedon queenslandica]|uniref:Uncharacterized protein n=1 Tax=Amphimedon queenslandica TaxID=400682 RepID=A0A1X7UR05_AMPQE|nr:PREDICTED: uncharacterized protein LOC109582573 [Amphimedon queenslandica]|eukprot:XP_019852889.1 PREDICTED: uncharacterized protein LOC109582573 [Amphimedon queenslandica]